MFKNINCKEILLIIIPIIGGLVTWYLTEQAKLDHDSYIKREERFTKLVSTIHGFGIKTLDLNQMDNFIKELDLSWLYCSDEVILKAYEFLESVADGTKSNKADRQRILGELIVAIRKDLIDNNRLTKTNLKPSDFKLLRVQ